MSVDIEELAAHLDRERLKDVKEQYEARATNATAAFLLCFFLGYLGAHRFYVGQWRAGLARLAPFILGVASVVAGFLTAAPLNAALFVIGGVLVLASLIWEIIDLGRIDKEIHQRNTLLAEGLIAGALLSDSTPIEEAARKLDDAVRTAAAQSLAAGAAPAASAIPAGMITAEDLAQARALAEESGQAAISYHEISNYAVSATPEERAGAAPSPAPVAETERHVITEPLPESQTPALEEATYIHHEEGYRVTDSEETDRVSGPSAAGVVGLSAAALGAAELSHSAAAGGAHEALASEPVVGASPEPVISPMPEPAMAHAPETLPVEAPTASAPEPLSEQADVTDAWAPETIAPAADVAYSGSSPSYIALPDETHASATVEPDRASEPYAGADAATMGEATLEPEVPVYFTPGEPASMYAPPPPAPEPAAESYVPPVPDVYSASAPQPETYRPSWEEPTAPSTPTAPETLAELAEAGAAAGGAALAASAMAHEASEPAGPAPAAPKMKRIRVKHRIVVEGQVVREETVEREVPADMDMAAAVRQIQAELEQTSAATPDEIARIANLSADEEVEVRRHVEGLGQ